MTMCYGVSIFILTAESTRRMNSARLHTRCTDNEPKSMVNEFPCVLFTSRSIPRFRDIRETTRQLTILMLLILDFYQRGVREC